MKRKREDDESAVIKLRFDARSSSTGALVSKIFYARGYETVSKPTRADRYTLYDDEIRGWTRMPSGRTPVLLAEEDRACYQSEVRRHGLYEH